jgi:hypothetical protein
MCIDVCMHVFIQYVPKSLSTRHTHIETRTHAHMRTIHTHRQTHAHRVKHRAPKPSHKTQKRPLSQRKPRIWRQKTVYACHAETPECRGSCAYNGDSAVCSTWARAQCGDQNRVGEYAGYCDAGLGGPLVCVCVCMHILIRVYHEREGAKRFL